MKKLALYTVLLMLLVNACSDKEKADLIITNARIYTVDQTYPVAESFVVKEGKFLAVGNEADLIAQYPAENIIDMEGKFIYPGFIDAHCHFYGYCLTLLQADLRGTTSFDEILEIIQAHDKAYQADWVLGRSWDQNQWQIKEFPVNDRLNELFPDKPVYLRRVDGHAAIANAKALEMAGITAETQVDGGKVVVKDGKPTGVLIDNAMSLVSRLIPDVEQQQTIKAIAKGEQNCFAVGLTSVADAGLYKNQVLLIDSLQKAGKMKLRLYAMLEPTPENIDHFVKRGKYKTDHLNVQSIKLYADGALGSRGAALLEPYADDPGNYGLIIEPFEFYHQMAKLAMANDYQVCTHAIGDSANRLMLNIYAQYLQGKNDRRWRIEHAQIIHPDDLHKFGKYSIVPSIQSTHCTSDMFWADERLGEERIKNAYPYKQLLEQNGWLPNGTDFPVEKIDPLLTFYASVARKDLKGSPENGFQTANALTRRETLKSMTLWAARAAFEEHEKGSIEPGKMADFVVLDKDIMQIPEQEIPRTKVLYTFLDGVMVYQMK
ncbi:MAG: amidohydrolase [Bacteroidales bacterium]|jgi:predicted amidohydrolase YtcJ|nr:amidohydrolase [Bacteroidales bacterium]